MVNKQGGQMPILPGKEEVKAGQKKAAAEQRRRVEKRKEAQKKSAENLKERWKKGFPF